MTARCAERRTWLSGAVAWKTACAAPSVLIVALCCGVPLLWTVATLVRHSETLADLRLSGFRAGLLARTLGLNVLVGGVATVLALPAAWVLGRGRGALAKALWFVAPAALLVPVLGFSYGWTQAFRLSQPLWHALGVEFVPGSTADALRCVWTLAAWLWGVPACIVGLALRRLDPDLQLAALLHGSALRLTFRLLLGPIVASVAAVTVLATQEFAVYEPTGVSVVATEVRMVFSTGAFSSLPIAGPDHAAPGLEERTSAAVMAAAPLLVVTALLALVAFHAAGRLSPAGSLHVGDWPPILDPPAWVSAAATALAIAALGTPVIALVASWRSPSSPGEAWNLFAGPAAGSLLVAVGAAVASLVVALSASTGWTRGLLVVAVASFLLGGEMLAIALVRAFNRPDLGWTSDSWPVPLVAYVGRFVCIALVAGGSTWSPAWTRMRHAASVAGAGPLRTMLGVVAPLAWPTHIAAAVLVGALSLVEVPATATLTPQHPPVLTTKLLSWAHSARSDRMIEGSLLMIALVPALAAALAVLVRLGRRNAGSGRYFADRRTRQSPKS